MSLRQYVVYNLLRLVHSKLSHPTKPREVNKAMWMEVHAKEHTTKDGGWFPKRIIDSVASQMEKGLR